MPGKLTREEVIAAIDEMRWMPDEGHQPEGYHAHLADVLTRRFGLDGKPCLSQQVIADKYDVSKARVQAIERTALRCLRDHFLNSRRITYAAVTLGCLRARLRRTS